MKAILLLGIVLVAAAAGLAAQDPLSAAKDLYASAAYEDALSALSRLDGRSTAPDIARQADQYRAFCLYALGRTREAESIAESMIRKEPLVRLDAGDASPRIETMFADVRKRLLPSLIRDRFRTARSALDSKSFSDAEPHLIQARLMIVEAEKLGVKDDGLGDLSVLVDGFLQLIRSTAEQQAMPRPGASLAADAPSVAPRPNAPSAPETAPSTAASRPGPAPSAPRSTASSAPTSSATRAVSPPIPTSSAPRAAAPPVSASPAQRPGAPSVSAPPGPAANGTPHVYSIDDEDVSPPVAIDQRMPGLPTEMTLMVKALHTTGVFDVIIDETGRVVDATVRRSVNVGFDSAILRSARRWRYRPAMKDGVPVRYLKTLALIP